MGIAFGRSGMKDRFGTKKAKSSTSHYLLPTKSRAVHYWLSTTADDIHFLYKENPDRQSPIYDTDYQITAESSSDITILPPLSQCSSLEETDCFLFDYCLFAPIIPGTCSTDDIKVINTCILQRSLVDYDNPWRSIMLPMCFQSEGLLHIAIAWAAHSFGNLYEGRDISRYGQMVLRHKCLSLEYLRNMVPKNPGDQVISLARTRCERDALLLLIMFHCLLEIASGSTMEWTYHMRGAILIMKYYTNCCSTPRQGTFSQEVLELVHTFFIEKDTFSSTTTTLSSIQEGKYMESLKWSIEVPSMFPFLNSHHSIKVDPCMGLSLELLDIISCISEQARRRLMPSHSSDNSQIFASLKHRLNHLKLNSEGSDRSELMELNSIALEEATWIYLHHAIGDQPHHSGIIQTVHLPRLLDTLGSIHKAQGALLCFIPYPMWALFIASCVVLDEDRVKILDFFTLLKHKKPVSNVSSTMSAVKAIWKRRDLKPEEAYSHSTTWADVISQLGWKMPFT